MNRKIFYDFNYNKRIKKPLSQIRFNLNSDNGFCFVQFPVTVADVDIMVEMGGVEPPSENTDHLTFYKLSLLLNLTGDWLGDRPVRPRV